MNVFHCDHCGQLLFFENVNCVRCGRALAYVPELSNLVSLDHRPEDGEHNRWSSPLSATPFKLCDNYTKHNICNWALSFEDPAPDPR